MSFNKNFIMLASRNRKEYVVRILSGNKTCFVEYPDKELDIYSLSLLTRKLESNMVSFVQIAKNTASNHVVISQFTFNLTNCSNAQAPTTSIIHYTEGKVNDAQGYMFLKVDLQDGP